MSINYNKWIERYFRSTDALCELEWRGVSIRCEMGWNCKVMPTPPQNTHIFHDATFIIYKIISKIYDQMNYGQWCICICIKNSLKKKKRSGKLQRTLQESFTTKQENARGKEFKKKNKEERGKLQRSAANKIQQVANPSNSSTHWQGNGTQTQQQTSSWVECHDPDPAN